MKIRLCLYFLFLIALVLIQTNAWGQSVPLMIPHSGTVFANSSAFNGTGHFKFAITNGAATPTCIWTNGGSPDATCQSASAVDIPVNNGQYSVKLGDTSLTNMSAFSGSEFNTATTYLRIWFNDGTTGFQLLTPDRRLLSVPYALQAGNVVTGITGPQIKQIGPALWIKILSTNPPTAPLQTLTVSAPAPGYFLVIASGTVSLIHTSSAVIGFYCLDLNNLINDINSCEPGSSTAPAVRSYVPTSLVTTSTSDIGFPYTMTKVFPATAGVNDFYLNGYATNFDSAYLFQATLTAIFVPSLLP